MALTSRQLIPASGSPFSWFEARGQLNNSPMQGAELQVKEFRRADGTLPPNPLDRRNYAHAYATHFVNDPRPVGLGTTDVRRTVAMDVCFVDGYLSNSHFVFGPGNPGGVYTVAGDNRFGSIILGAYSSLYTKAAGLEEVQIGPGGTNIHHGNQNNFLDEHTWYRIAVDWVLEGSDVAIAGRIWNKHTNTQVYQHGLVWSAYPGNYVKTSDLITLGDVNGGGKVLYSNLTGYWGTTMDYVVSP